MKTVMIANGRLLLLLIAVVIHIEGDNVELRMAQRTLLELLCTSKTNLVYFMIIHTPVFQLIFITTFILIDIYSKISMHCNTPLKFIL
jgi:hypothetical protein